MKETRKKHCRRSLDGYKAVRDNYVMRRIAYGVVLGKSLVRIAKELDLRYADARKYTKREDFDVILNQLEDDIYGAIDRKVRHLFVKAVKKLDTLLESHDAVTVERAIDKVFQLNRRIPKIPVKPRDMSKYDEEERDATELDQEMDDRADHLGEESVKNAMKFMKATNEFAN